MPSEPVGRLVALHRIRVAGGRPEGLDSVRAVAGAGLEGDRHGACPPEEGGVHEVSLISAEALDALGALGLALAPGESRRQLTTRGVDLGALLGRRFRVGEVLLEGTKPCKPCGHLERLTRPGVKAGLEGRGGLYARILQGGVLRVGDPVQAVAAATRA